MPSSKLFLRETRGNCNSSPPQPLYFRLGNCTIPVASWYPSSITSISSWGLEAYIGVPSQPICLEASTFVNNMAIMASDICNGDNSSTFAQCVNRRGGLFNPAAATSNFTTASMNVLAPDSDWTKLNPPYASAAKATVQFVSDISDQSLPLALVENASNSSISQMGLGNDSVILHGLMNAEFIPANGFSFMPGSQSPTNWRDGHLILGGYDRGSLAGPFTTFPINSTYTVGQSSRACPLYVTVNGLSLSLPGQADIPLISAGTTMETCIEPLDNLFRLPKDRLLQFQALTNWNANVSVPSDIFVIEPGLYYDTPFEGNLTFSIEGGPVVTIPSSELSWQARGLDSSGNKVLVDNITVVNIFHDTVEDTAVFGKVFLSQLLLAVNYQTQEFKIAPAITQGPTILDLVSFNDTALESCQSASSSGLRVGLIVVGVILGLLIVALIMAGLYLLKRRQKASQSAVEKMKNTSNSSLATKPHEPYETEGNPVLTNITSHPDTTISGRRDTVVSTLSVPTSTDDPRSPLDGVIEMASPTIPERRQHELEEGSKAGPIIGLPA